MTKLKNSKSDKVEKLKLCPTYKTQIMTKHKHSKCDKNQKLKLRQN